MQCHMLVIEFLVCYVGTTYLPTCFGSVQFFVIIHSVNEAAM